MQEFILKNLMTIVFILFLVYGFSKGFSEGFVKKILSFGSLIITIIVTRTFTPLFANTIKDVSNVESTLTTKIYDFIANNNLYDSLNVPVLKDAINTGNIESTIRDGLCTSIANVIINLLCGIIIFILTLILIKLIIRFLDIIDYIPIIGQLNKLLGGILGFFEILIVISIIFAILRFLNNIPQIRIIIDNIESSPIVGEVYKNNHIYNFFSNFFAAKSTI